MIITAIDDKKDLFLISDLVTEELMVELSKVVLEDIPSTISLGQEHWKRRKLVVESESILEQIEYCITSQTETIGKLIGKSIRYIHTMFWLDFQGFTVRPHFDHSFVGTVLHLYLKDCENMGTVFYNPNKDDIEYRDDNGQLVHYTADADTYSTTPIRHAFECKKNTGYLMVNNDKQLHGVPNILPDSELRLSAYCYLNFDTIDE